MQKHWIGPPAIDAASVKRLSEDLGVPLVVARILAGRGHSDPATARAFLHPQLTQLSSPHLFRGAGEAIDRLRHALTRGERILILGDFDVDGVTGTSLALRTLQKLGAQVDYILPHRLHHGYGLSKNVLPDIFKKQPHVLLTVDCGIRSVEEIEIVSRRGIDVLLTDHHEPGPELPPALAIVDPKQPGCPYPDKRLAAVGVMFQILRGLVESLEHEMDLDSELDLVALGTVADVVPLEGENRALVARGLEVMNSFQRVGLLKLAQAAGIEGRLESWHLAYLLGPRINAAGRLGDASAAVRLLTATDTTVATVIARQLDDDNRQRQEYSNSTLLQAMAAIERGTAGKDPAGIVLASNVWHPGVLGIASSKLVERFHRPCALISMQGGDQGRGSVRSIPGIDVCAVLQLCDDLLIQHGGHEMAAGLTIERARVPEFRERFSHAVDVLLTEENRQPKVSIDCEIHPDEIGELLLEQLDVLGPFGYGNSRPTFLLRGASSLSRARVVGRGHLKVQLRREGQPPLDCIGFDMGSRAESGGWGESVDVIGHLAANDWNGRRMAQMQIVDFRAAEAAAL